jgi:hypothetical protein
MPTPRDKQVITTVRKSDLVRIDGHADAQDVSRAALIYRYIIDGLNADDIDAYEDEGVEPLATEPGADGRIALVNP